MPSALITTAPFADKDPLPVQLLEAAGVKYQINTVGRKLKEAELAEMLTDFDVLIAGTEPITERVIKQATNLRMISRVGVGLDSVDLLAAKRHGIKVSYTPDAPAPAVAELTISLIFSLLRSTHMANTQMHRGEWKRHFGRRISDVTIGIIGLGRIGTRVLQTVALLGVPQVLVNDSNPKLQGPKGIKCEWVDKEVIYRDADVISLHVPLTGTTKNMIRRDHLLAMKKDAIIINTARGGIINEQDLANVMAGGHLGSAAIDVFEKEPYEGELANIERCLLTSHMGSMSIDCRARMELEATEEAIRFLSGKALRNEVPQEEYDLRLHNS